MKVLAIRTKEGHYLEFATIRANLEDGTEITVDLTQAVFVQILEVGVPDPLAQFTAKAGSDNAPTNGHREPSTIAINGAGGIESQENVKGMG